MNSSIDHLVKKPIDSSLFAAFPSELTWTPEVMMTMKVISDVQPSPDHQSVLFVVTEPQTLNEKEISLSRIFKGNSLNKENAIPFSDSDSSSTQPRWSPDGKWIAFISNRTGSKNLYLINANGGEATPLTKGKKDIQTFAWSPDSQKIAFVREDQTEKDKAQEKTSLAYVYKEDGSVNRLWLIDLSSPEKNPKALTSDLYCVRGLGDYGTINAEFDWSPDSENIVFAYGPGLCFDYFHLDSSIAMANISSGIITSWEKKARFESLPRFSPDGKWVGYVSDSSSEMYAINRHLAVRSVKGEQYRLLASTYNEGAFLAGPSLLGWSKEGDHLLFFEPKETKYHIVLVPIDGSATRSLDTGEFFFKEPNLSYDRSHIGFVAQSPATPPEAFVAKLSDFATSQVSNLNASLLTYPKTETHLITWASNDGTKIEGLLTYPIGYVSGKKYPLLLVIHGGPMGVFDETFLGTPNPYPIASFAQEGFLVFRPNPRGSTGYGKDFRCANYKDWGGGDFIDIETGVDSLIDRGLADAERLGVMGWSYGGYLTAWTITQTSRYKSASMGAGLSNLISMSGTTELHRFFIDYFGNLIENSNLYIERSPISYISKAETPCLIQHGTADKRVPVSQAYEFYHALDNARKQPTLILYPEMGHRITDPKMQLDAMKSNLSWFHQHIDP